MYIPTTVLTSGGGGGDVTLLYDETLVGSGAFDVQNIPQDYAHLKIYLSARGTQASAQESLFVRFNNDSGGTSYAAQAVTATAGVIAGAGAAGVSRMHVAYVPAASAAAGQVAAVTLEVPDYAGTTFFKSIVVAASSYLASFYWLAGSGTWGNTGAVNRIQIFPENGSFAAGSRITIYGFGA